VSVKDQFTESEWNSVIQSPMLAGVAVTAADPGGLWAAVKEGSAMALSLVDAKRSAASGSLLNEIGLAFDSSENRGMAQDGVKELLSGKSPAEAAAAAVTRVGEIASLVSAKVPAEAAAFKEYLLATAQRVADAAKEGGFLGFGGERVSEAEKKTLDELSRVLASS
jgi:hypothetical protein